jgi:tetratricopeptide (TPR) repeat protein
MTVVENAPLVAEMERALDALLRSGNASEAALSRIAAVEAAAWDELVTGAGTPPPDFRARFFGEADGTPAWRDILRALLREALTEKPRVKSAFDISRLAALREETAAIGQAVAALAGDTTALRTTMEAIQAELRELRQLVDRLTRNLSLSESEKRALVSDLARVRAEQQGTLALVTGFLETMVGRHVPPEQFSTTLFAIARDSRQAGERIDALSASRNLSPRAEALRDQARAAHAAGRLDDARQALAAMAAEEGSALTRLEAHAAEIEAERRTLRTSLAQTKAAQAAVEKAGLRYREAAALYQEASALVAFDPRAAWQWLLSSADVLGDYGREYGDNAALKEAIARYQEALAMARRNRVPLDWAATQNNLANALCTLGGRESGTARLEEAVATFRLVLGKYRRDRVPLEWAMTQNNLGIALATLGARESGTARLEEAVSAFRLALEERRRDRVPLDWAASQNNLGNAMWVLGERESSKGRLEEAVVAYRRALEVYHRDRAPLAWARTQNNLGNAFLALGICDRVKAQLKEAVASYRLALEVYRYDRMPLLWAETTENIAIAEEALGTRTAPRLHWQSALNNVTAALEEYARVGSDYHIAKATTLRDRLLARLFARR